MKSLYTSLFLSLSIGLFANQLPDSTHKNWEFHGIIQVNNNGISPVPAFSLGKPALMTTFFAQKGGFIFSPEFNYGLDGKPWVVNQWLRFQKRNRQYTYRMGISTSLFFKREQADIKLNQYMALEGFIGCKISEKSTLNLMYWNSHGLDSEAVKSGHFLSLSANISKIPISKSIFFEFRPNLFYIKNKIPFEGLFVSAITNVSCKNCPVSLFAQGVQPLWAKPASAFNYNFGLNYIF